MSLSPDFFDASLDSQAPRPLTLSFILIQFYTLCQGDFIPSHGLTYVIENFFNRVSLSEPQNAECNPSACFLSSPEN